MKRVMLLTCVLVLVGLTLPTAEALGRPDASVAVAAREMRASAGSHRLVLIGEMHGTREAPALAGALLTAYAGEGPVVLALEIGISEQDAIDNFIASDGRGAARKALVAGKFWQVSSDQHDGRRNWDAVALLERVRRLRAEGRDVAVLALDTGSLPAGGKASSQARDAAMARRLRAAFAQLPRGRMLVLTGNVHAMRTRPSFAPPEMQAPMGSYLADLSPYSVDVTAMSGAFWACMGGACGPRPMMSQPIATGARDGEPFDFQVVLPSFTLARLFGDGASK